jgi:hypothetical protein
VTSEYTKAERKALRELSGTTYEAEAHLMLEELDAEFQSWRTGEMESSELLRAIHEFHQHQSRELWSMYQGLEEPDIVARGIALGLLKEPLSEELRTKLAPLIELYEKSNR